MYSSSQIEIGNISLGGNSPIRIQSMTNTNTMDTTATVNQVANLAGAGCDFVRITTQTINEANNLKLIKEELTKIGIDTPVIADIHFNPNVAKVAAQYVEKIRINPGNYIVNKKSISQDLITLLDICNKYQTVIRIGVNQGSLSDRILYKYGNTARGMVESLLEFVIICRRYEFNNIVLSIKSSNIVTTIEANMLLVNRLAEEGLSYPIHLGVTEAGSEIEGRVKSAAGIGYLLAHGIGDTIRVSLTENPIAEVPVAKHIIRHYKKQTKTLIKLAPELIKVDGSNFNKKPPFVVTSGLSEFSDYNMSDNLRLINNEENKVYNILKFSYTGLSFDELMLSASADATIVLIDNSVDGIWIENESCTYDQNAQLSLVILQVLGMRISSAEFVACPTCGRSSVGLPELLGEVKEQTNHLIGLKIAVMGCSVNGPGEMEGADYGLIGSGIGKVDLYKAGTIIKKKIPVKAAIIPLINLIKYNGDWQEK